MHCVKASARSKPHRRISHPESYTLSVDLSGKMVVGQGQSRHDCRYMMVAVYTFPVGGSGRWNQSSLHCWYKYTPTDPGRDDPGVEYLPEEALGLDEIPGRRRTKVGRLSRHGRRRWRWLRM